MDDANGGQGTTGVMAQHLGAPSMGTWRKVTSTSEVAGSDFGRAPVRSASMTTDLEEAWNDVHDARPPGWYVGRPGYSDRLKVWEQYAYMPAETRRGVGRRTHEWTAVGQTELGVVREMGRCLREIREGRVPE